MTETTNQDSFPLMPDSAESEAVQPDRSRGEYPLVDGGVPPVESAVAAGGPALPPSAAPSPESTFQAAQPKSQEQLDDFPEDPPVVDAVWTRWSEWRQPILWGTAGLAAATLILFGGPYVAVLIFVLSVSFTAYRIITSLEVPVRVTPEQAVTEFFNAASHRLPNFDRMYILLTSDAKQCDDFHSFPQFKAYWSSRIKEYCRSPNWLVPIDFHVEGFTCRYNENKTMALAHYSVKVAARARPELVRPLAVIEARNLLVKGPDGQWHLNDGRLPEE